MKSLSPLVCFVAAACAIGCSRQDTQLQQHKESLESLAATTAAITHAWLEGDVSGTYAITALERTFTLAEQERAALVAVPAMLQDPRGAYLSQAGEQLSRAIAGIAADVRDANGQQARGHVADIPLVPPKQP
jgi:hypothetical protein